MYICEVITLNVLFADSERRVLYIAVHTGTGTGFLLMVPLTSISMTKYHSIHYQLSIHVSSAVSIIFKASYNVEIGQCFIAFMVIGMLLGCYYTNHT